MSDSTLETILDRFGEAKVLACGDLWLERRLRGDAAAGPGGELRIRVAESSPHAGGAAAVACAAAAMGARAWVAGVLGRDTAAGEILRALGAAGVDAFAMVSDSAHGTGEKLRLSVAGELAGPWREVEIETCPSPPLAEAPAAEMLTHIEAVIRQIGAVVVLPASGPAPGAMEKLSRLASANGKALIGVLAQELPASPGGISPPCDLAVLRAPQEQADEHARRLTREPGHKAVIVLRPQGGAELHRKEATQGEVIKGPSFIVRGAFESFMAGVTAAMALGADPLSAGRIGAAAAAKADGHATADDIRREITAA